MVYTIEQKDDNGEVTNGDKKSSWCKGVGISFIASLPFFTHGVETIELSASAHSGHFRAPESVPWNATALLLAAIVSAPIYCYVIDKYGRKVGLFIVSLVQGASCIPLFLPRDLTSVIALHLVAGIATSGLFIVIPIYVREVNTLQTKGLSLCLMMVMTTFGYLMKMMMNTEHLMYVLAGMVMVQLLSMLVMIESPCYLVKRGKMEAAKDTLKYLKSLDENNQKLVTELQDLKDESERARSKGKLNVITILRNDVYRDGTKIGIILHTTTVLCGSIVFLDEEKTLAQLQMPADPNRTLVLTCLCAGSIFTLLLIRFVERRYLITFGFAVMVLSMGLLAVYTQMDLTVTSSRWVPVASLGTLVFGYGVAWGLPYVIMVEIYNLEIRATMVAVLVIYTQIIRLIHINTFQYIEDYMGIYSVFYIFTFINLYGGVYGLFAIPDLRDKAARHVEKQLKRVPLLKFNTRSLHATNTKVQA